MLMEIENLEVNNLGCPRQPYYMIGWLSSPVRQNTVGLGYNRQGLKGLCILSREPDKGQEQSQHSIASIDRSQKCDAYQGSKFALLCTNL